MEEVIFACSMLLVGLGVGVLSGALGLGGGVLMVPAFLTFVPGMDVHTAKGTSLFLIFFVALLNSFRLHKNQLDKPWRLAAMMAVGSLSGSYFGAWITTRMPEQIVLVLFMLLLALLAVRTFFLHPVEVRSDQVRRRMALSLAIGFTAGLAGGATGTGGGLVLVPLALWAGIVSNAQVVGLSNMVMIGTAGAGAIPHLLAPMTFDRPWVVGQVYFPLIPLVFLAAQLGSPWGVRLNAHLTLHRRRWALGVLLSVIALRVLWRITAST
jgi:uncharacterized protein